MEAFADQAPELVAQRLAGIGFLRAVQSRVFALPWVKRTRYEPAESTVCELPRMRLIDLADGNPTCANNIWSANTFGTADPACAGG